MIKNLIHKIQTVGLDSQKTYQDKKDLVAFNSTFLWTSVLIFINIFVALLSKLNYVASVNAIATASFPLLLIFNRLGYFKIVKHFGFISANVYVYFQSLMGGPDLQFQYAYCIILTMIGFVCTRRSDLLIHLFITIVFFIFTKISYYYVSPFESIPLDQRDGFAFNNGIIFLILISICANVFRNQTNIYIKELEDIKNEIEEKKNVIEEKQKEIFDSINYANRIQTAILAHTDLIDENLKKEHNFILFQPKDIVSGDFYWADLVHAKYKIDEPLFHINKYDELFYLGICDSTGHGVPGAFMSFLNMGFLKEAVREKNIYEPNRIFGYVREQLIKSISNQNQKDGFDGIVICLNMNTGKMCYAASNNNPVVISGGKIIHLPCDKMPVGKGEIDNDFNLYQINYHHGDMLYMYTDGYADQFGGPKGKKYKYKQLEELLLHCSNMPLHEQKHALLKSFNDWKGNLEQIDDVCMAGIRF